MTLAALGLLGCALQAPAPPPAAPVPAPPRAAPAAVLPSEAAPAPPRPRIEPAQVVVDVTDRARLSALEGRGLALHAVLGAQADAPARPSTAWLHDHLPAWQDLHALLGADIEAAAAGVDRPLVVEHADAVRWPAGNVGRRLDPRWLRSELAFVQLAGIVARVDRRDLSQGRSCGELRLIYRLAYQEPRADHTVGSRLPVTFNVVLDAPAGEGRDCAEEAARWVLPADAGVDDLLAGPLDNAGRVLDRIEVNAQVVRFPSGVETGFAGQALYLLEVLGVGPDGRLARRPLENTPDVLGIRADPGKQAALDAWIADNLDAIDQGTHALPAALAATRALSWSTLGINRRANKPFATLYRDRMAALPTVDGAARRFVASPEGLLERLDGATCAGCHQARSTAGFHFLGLDDPGLAGVSNRLLLPGSPHYADERVRRAAYVAAVASGLPPDTLRAHPLEALHGAPAGAGAACVPAEEATDLVRPWDCAEGLSCRVLAAEPGLPVAFGQCVVDAVEELRAGMACREGVLRPGPASEGGLGYAQRAYADRAELRQRYDLPEDQTFSESSYNCRPTVIGVPLGRTYRRCTAAERRLEGVLGPDGAVADEICAVVGGSRFDACVEGDFHECLDGIVARGMVDACHAGRACREDYICQALPWQLDGVPDEAGRALAEAGVGFCTPTYFLFQLRLDGHPTPG